VAAIGVFKLGDAEQLGGRRSTLRLRFRRALYAWSMPQVPKQEDRELRMGLIRDLVMHEVEEALHFIQQGVTSIATGGTAANFTAIEESAELLVDRHNRRWPLVSWLLAPQVDPTLSPGSPFGVPERERLSQRADELGRAIREIAPAFWAKLRGAVRREPRLLPAVGLKVLAASVCIGLYQTLRIVRVWPRGRFRMMNAFLAQMVGILRVCRLPAEELLVNLGELGAPLDFSGNEIERLAQ